jgi:hypothetical protein
MMIVIGSKALALHGIEVDRPKYDIDVVGEYDEIVEFAKTQGNIRACYPTSKGNKLVVETDKVIIEGEITWEGSSAAALRDLILNDSDTAWEKRPNGYIIPSLNILYMLKMSHRYLRNSPHFLKTMRDIQMLRAAGAVIDVRHEEFYKQRMKDTYYYAHPKLDQSKGDFFKDDGIKYVYDHDSIHEVVKRMESPAYTFFKPKDSEVMCDKDMFFNAPLNIRLNAGLEEAMVLALERSQIPFPDLWTTRRSFDFALMKVCTSITSGWFREFCWENYDAISERYDPNYVDEFWQAVEDGKVTLHNPDKAY